MRLNLMAIVALCVVALTSCDAHAQRRSRRVQWQPACHQAQSQPVIAAQTIAVQTGEVKTGDAIDEVNAERARRGLQPFQHDPQLTVAAREAARQRAAGLIAGHLPNDFACLPAAAHATAAGCAAWEPSWGWGACCTYDNYTYGGAAWVMGSDGRRYMHLFVR